MFYIYAVVDGDCPELGVVCQGREVPIEAERVLVRAEVATVLGCVVHLAEWLDLALAGGDFVVYGSPDLAFGLLMLIPHMAAATLAGEVNTVERGGDTWRIWHAFNI